MRLYLSVVVMDRVCMSWRGGWNGQFSVQLDHGRGKWGPIMRGLYLKLVYSYLSS